MPAPERRAASFLLHGCVNVHFRWRTASDTSNGGPGYWFDDVQISAGTSCTAGVDDRIFKDGFDGT